MTKEKLLSLTKYANDLKSRLSSDIPEKHAHRPMEYQEFLKRELSAVTNTIEEAKMSVGESKAASK